MYPQSMFEQTYIYIYIFVSNDKYGVRKCNRANCGLCIHLIKGSTISFKCGINFKVHESMSCNVQNVIFVMRCRGYGEEYIGETENGSRYIINRSLTLEEEC